METTNDFLTFRAKNIYKKSSNLDEKISTIKEKISTETNYRQKGILRQQLLKIQKDKNQVLSSSRDIAGILKTDLDFINQSVENSKKNLDKTLGIFKRREEKYLQNVDSFNKAVQRIDEYTKDQKKSDKLIVNAVKKIEKQKEHLVAKKELSLSRLNKTTSELIKIESAKALFEKETVERIESDFSELFKELEINPDKELEKNIQKDYKFLKRKYLAELVNFDEKIKKLLSTKNFYTQEIKDYDFLIDQNLEKINQKKDQDIEAVNRVDQNIKDMKLTSEVKKMKRELDSGQKLLNRYQKIYEKNLNYKTKLEQNLEFFSTTIGVDLELVDPGFSKLTISFNLVEKLFLQDWFFMVIVSLLGSGVVLGTYMYIEFGVGALNEIFVIAMLREGLDQNDYTAALSFASGFLIARILEGPLVGILDVGGSILTGLGIGIPAVFLSTPNLAFMMYNPFYAFLIGLVGGLIIGIMIMVIRLIKPKGNINLGTDIMIGAGNTTGKFLGPLVVFSAAMFQPLIGLGAGLGAIGFMWVKKPIVGGAIIGAMIFGLIPAFI